MINIYCVDYTGTQHTWCGLNSEFLSLKGLGTPTERRVLKGLNTFQYLKPSFQFCTLKSGNAGYSSCVFQFPIHKYKWAR